MKTFSVTAMVTFSMRTTMEVFAEDTNEAMNKVKRDVARETIIDIEGNICYPLEKDIRIIRAAPKA